MSHFTVLVVLDPDGIVPDPDNSVEAALAPYMENCCGEPEKRYMQFYDEEDNYLKEWEEESVEKVVMPDGTTCYTWDDRFTKKTREDPLGFMSGRPEPPPELEKRVFRFKELFPTFEQFVAEWHGRKKRDETYNRYGYWQNPRAKWDWYEIGGRWAGYFQLKEGRAGLQGKQYNMEGKYEPSEKADVCRKGDIDWEGMQAQEAKEAGEQWELVNGAFGDLPVCLSWPEILAKYGKEDIDQARKEYWAQPRVKACQTDQIREIIGWMGEAERFQVSKEIYIQRAVEQVGVTHAVVKEGQWYESGEMGWWGITTGDKDPETWASMFQQLMRDLPDDAVLVLCDCHI